ncbi:hypothetical protein [Cohnella faecalis]|uniref:Uncharacterized protein n=1 Tax=Cohnella faecalis TaxID=2315694 RepID=A0A398CL89_9BACL|nr:hypothetical protein [Cohnella faecalis]RIE04116.1 hypothetical protein D3H35_09245 [Cohnella faecalis]
MAKIHERQQELGRPVRLELGIERAAFRIDLVVVGINTSASLCSSTYAANSQRVRRQFVVLIQEDKKFSEAIDAALFEAALILPLLSLNSAECGRPSSAFADHRFDRRIGAGVVDDAQLQSG